MLKVLFKKIKSFFLLFVLIVSYLPLVYGFVFSFNSTSRKEAISGITLTLSSEGYVSLINKGIFQPLVNSFLIATIVSIFVGLLALITCFALWWRHNSFNENFVSTTSQVIIINPDIITAIALSILFSTFFGVLKVTEEGFFRLVISYSVIALPYSIFIMLPRSKKFSRSLFEASLDLGYGLASSWFRTYLRHMLPAIFASTFICFIFTFDDFILARIISNASTLGTLLYEQKQLRTWILALGTLLLLFSLTIFWFQEYLAHSKQKQKNGLLNSKHLVNDKLLLLLFFCLILVAWIVFFTLLGVGFSRMDTLALKHELTTQ